MHNLSPICDLWSDKIRFGLLVKYLIMLNLSSICDLWSDKIRFGPLVMSIIMLKLTHLYVTSGLTI